MKTIVATMLLTFAFNMSAEASGVGQLFKAGARKNALVTRGFSPMVKDHIEEGLKKVSAISDAKHVVINNTYVNTQNKLLVTVEKEIMKDGSTRPVLVVSTSEYVTQESLRKAKKAGNLHEVADSLKHIAEDVMPESSINEQLMKPRTSSAARVRDSYKGDYDAQYTIVLDLFADKKGRKVTQAEFQRRINAASEILTGIASRMEGRESQTVLSRASKSVKARTQK